MLVSSKSSPNFGQSYCSTQFKSLHWIKRVFNSSPGCCNMNYILLRLSGNCWSRKLRAFKFGKIKSLVVPFARLLLFGLNRDGKLHEINEKKKKRQELLKSSMEHKKTNENKGKKGKVHVRIQAESQSHINLLWDSFKEDEHQLVFTFLNRVP